MRRTCPVCGKIFETKTCRKYCSEECFKRREVIKRQCALCGRVFYGDKKKRYCSTECRQDTLNMASGKKSICWTCQNFAGNCTWSRYFIPVEGWEAKPIKKVGTYLPSYIVKQCPEYIKDLPRRKK